MADKNGLKKFGQGAAELGKAGIGVAASAASVAGSIGKTGGKAANGAFSFAGSLLSGAASFVTKHPKISLLVGTYASIKGIQHVLRKRKEQNGAELENTAPRELQQPDSYAGFAQPAEAEMVSEETLAGLSQALGETQPSQAAPAPAAREAAVPAAAAAGNWADQVAYERRHNNQHQQRSI